MKIKLVLRKSKRKQGKENSLNYYEEIKKNTEHKQNWKGTKKSKLLLQISVTERKQLLLSNCGFWVLMYDLQL